MLAEAEKRDHRKLGAELDLFSFPTEIGSGLPVFHPKGAIIRRVMEDYSRRRHEEAGYQYVNTPHLTKAELFEISGHLGFYAESMFPPMELDGATYYMKPMNCPMHVLIYQSRGRSYRELPLRLFEFGTVYRYEKSGVVHGLTRARGFTQDDSHIFCTRGAAGPASWPRCWTSSSACSVTSGSPNSRRELSTRPEKYVGGPEEWAAAEAALKHALDSSGLPYVVAEGEGAFYAPKIDVHVKDAIGRRWQLSTLQVDFQEPGRFGIEYQAADGSRQRPYMIHRALFGSIERFFGILVEHYAGRVPALAGPGPGDRHPDHRRARALPGEGRRPAARARHPGGGRHQRRPDAEEDPQRAAAEGAVHAAGRGRGRGQGRGLVPLPRRRAAQRRRPSDEADRRDRVGGGRAASRSDPCLRTNSVQPDDGVSEVTEQDGVGDAGRLRPAVDAAPDGLHQGREPVGRTAGEGDGCPFCRIPDADR